MDRLIPMYRATVVYALMIVLSGLILWVIIAIGSRLTAPPDLAGLWSVDPSDSGGKPMVGNFSIEQSGRFAMFRFDGVPPVAYTLVNQTPASNGAAEQIDFESSASKISATGSAGGDDFRFSLTGSTTAQFRAHRTWRAYAPTDSESTSTSGPSTKP
jgi:hypothetical protein